MSNKIFYVIFVVTFVFKSHVKGFDNNKIIRTFAPESDFYYHNGTTKIPNIIKDNPVKLIKVKNLESNNNSGAITRTVKTKGTEKIYYTKSSITDNTPQMMRFKPIKADNYIKVDPFVLKEFDKHFNLKIDEYTPSVVPDTGIPESVTESYVAYRKSTYRSKFHGPHTNHTARVWEPDEPTFTRPDSFITRQDSIITRQDSIITRQDSSDELPAKSVSIRTKRPFQRRKFVPSDAFYKVQLSQERSREVRKNKCKNFMPSKIPFDYRQMQNIWQTMYYRIPDKIRCFQILIKNIPQEQRDIYQRNYGNFSGAVDWQNIRLEISATTNIGRKHFLQGGNEDMGIFENIVISRDVETGELVIHEETPDQWLVVGHLLLMRDCDNGGIVVFSKVPYVPRRNEIEDALGRFNEYYSTGKLTCDEDEVINKSIEAEEDVQSFWNN